MAMDDAASEAQDHLEHALTEIKKVIVGQEQLLERVMVGLLAGGHLLIEGVPGLAKTKTVSTLARVLGGTDARIQFTPDLVPSDLVGTRIYRADGSGFDTEKGPVFCNLLLADEINRAPAKVQSALLEVMQERQVTIGRETYPVPDPFLVLATMNPIESEGTYALPEAQVDRFMMKVLVDYPTPREELEVVRRSLVGSDEVQQVLGIEQLHAYQAAAAKVFVDQPVAEYAVALVTATRQPGAVRLGHLAQYVDYGASPRATLALVHGARALALLRGRAYVVPHDIADLAPDVMRHRLVMSYQALAEGVHADSIVESVVGAVPQPRIDLHRTQATA
jgi:MoxR-like ATPase